MFKHLAEGEGKERKKERKRERDTKGLASVKRILGKLMTIDKEFFVLFFYEKELRILYDGTRVDKLPDDDVRTTAGADCILPGNQLKWITNPII